MKIENQYLKFDEYKGFMGSLSEMPFRKLEYRAEKEIDRLTSNRFRKISEYPFELKACVFDLIDELYSDEQTGCKSSETVGNYSVTFDKPISSEKRKRVDNLIKTYLSETKVNNVYVLYCGADEDEK